MTWCSHMRAHPEPACRNTTGWLAKVVPSPAVSWILMPLPGSSATLAIELGFSQVAPHPRVQQLGPRRGGDGVDHRGLARLLEARGERSLGAMYRACQQERAVVLELVGREHVAPRAHRRQRRILAWVALRRQRDRLQRRVLRQDLPDFVL